MLFKFENSDDNCLKFVNNYFNSWITTQPTDVTLTQTIILFKSHVMGLSFISTKNLLDILRYLNRVVRVIYLSKKYLKRWKSYYINKKQPINTSDLELNPIDFTHIHKYINYIDYEQKQHYLFSINDFTNLIYTNLENCYQYDIVPQPLEMKNPYTNKVFTKNEIVDLSDQYCGLTAIPFIWHMFIDCYYDVELFKTTHYEYLLTRCIPSYIDKLEDLDIRYYLFDIFNFLEINEYCNDCIREKKHFRSKTTRKTLIYWVESLKSGKDIDDAKIEPILKLYSKKCKIHNMIEKCNMPVPRVLVKEIGDKIEIKPFYIDFSYPLEFSMGTYTKEDKRRYKDKRREKMRLKKSGKVKTI